MDSIKISTDLKDMNKNAEKKFDACVLQVGKK